MAKRKSKHKGISRIDTADTHGYYARVYHNCRTYSKLFSDRVWGGKRKAMDAAIQWRQDEAKRIQKLAEKDPSYRKRARSNTGVIGVSKTMKRNRNGTISPCYSVSWHPKPGIHKCTSFSIRRHGDKKAFKLACEFREARVKDYKKTRPDDLIF